MHVSEGYMFVAESSSVASCVLLFGLFNLYLVFIYDCKVLLTTVMLNSLRSQYSISYLYLRKVFNHIL